MVRALKTVVEILNGSADAMAATNKIQAEAIKLAPTAAAIYAIAQGVF